MTGRDILHVLVRPVLIWIGLLALLAATLGYAYLPGAPLKLWFGLAVGVAKAALIVWLFMQLRRAAGLVRVAATGGLVWASLMYVLALSDFLTRR